MDNEDIRETLKRYEGALNGGAVEEILDIYTEDAVFSPQGGAPQQGREALRAVYEGIAANAKIDITFEFLEVTELSDDWAFVRSTSRGTSTAKATGNVAPAHSYEFFILQKPDGENWLIARYMFNAAG